MVKVTAKSETPNGKMDASTVLSDYRTVNGLKFPFMIKIQSGAGDMSMKITEVKFSKGPSEKDDDKGITKWKLKLAPAEKREITIEFIVTHPKDMVVGGL